MRNRFFKRYINNLDDDERFFRIKMIDILLIIVAVTALIYVYWLNTNSNLKIGFGFFIAIATVGYVIGKYWITTDDIETEAGITKLILLDEKGAGIKEWYIQGETSLLIGKSSKHSEVDIDLSDAEYASLISKQHAVLNYADGNWYIEDIDSKNGTGIKQAYKSAKSRLEAQEPYRIGTGDVIYIANTKILCT
ncbi:FHA domain-containing protein [Aneurinibacillus aneurinilyticus]|uniref:FHA domain-containing protein n=1 Tax=Aneurinibacillus aneurinilyticus TaxID=1391 RepID=UPI0023F6EEB2|nr:FHA domain-containing protein [Aneurinibacillus aneurinilyticus]MCI1695992.1 FHA domain-containing protein [Aneurinibacillus aneurinilyticus]